MLLEYYNFCMRCSLHDARLYQNTPAGEEGGVRQAMQVPPPPADAAAVAPDAATAGCQLLQPLPHRACPPAYPAHQCATISLQMSFQKWRRRCASPALA